MIEQLKTIREFVDRVPHETSCALGHHADNFCDCGKQETLTALTQLEVMVGKQEPVAKLHDDGYWTPMKTEAGRALNDRLMRAGSPPIDVYTAPVAQQQQAEVAPVVDRVYEAAKRLVDHADFQLGGVLSAKSKARDIPSNAASKVKARHLASLRDALAKAPQQAEAVPTFDEQLREVAKRAIPQQAEAVPFNHATQLQIAYVKGLGDGAMQAEAVPPDVEVIRKALERAFIMGQNYWADADSESYSANKRSDVTRQKFNAMRDEVCAAIAQQKGGV